MKLSLFGILCEYVCLGDSYTNLQYRSRYSVWSGNYSIFTNISSQTNLYSYLSNECQDRLLFLENLNALLFTTISNFVHDNFFSKMSIDESEYYINKALMELSQSLRAQRLAIFNVIGRHLVYVKERFEEQGEFFFNHAALSINYMTDIYLTRIETYINKDLFLLIIESGIINKTTKNVCIFDQWVRCHLKVFFNTMIYKALEEYQLDVQNLLKHVLRLQIKSNLNKKGKLIDLLDEYRIATMNNPLCCFNFNKTYDINSIKIPVLCGNINSDLKEVDLDTKYLIQILNIMLNKLNLLCVSCREYNAAINIKDNSNSILNYINELKLYGTLLQKLTFNVKLSEKLALHKKVAPNLVALFSYTKLELFIICSCRLIDVSTSAITRTIHEIIDKKSKPDIICVITSFDYGPIILVRLSYDIEDLKSILLDVTEKCKSSVKALLNEVEFGNKIIKKFNQNNNDFTEKTIISLLNLMHGFVKNEIFEMCLNFLEHAYFNPFNFLQHHDEFTSAKWSRLCKSIFMETLTINNNTFTNKIIQINDNVFDDFSAKNRLYLDKTRVAFQFFIANLSDEEIRLTKSYWNYVIDELIAFVKKLKKSFYKLYYADNSKFNEYFLSLTRYLYDNHAFYHQNLEKRKKNKKIHILGSDVI